MSALSNSDFAEATRRVESFKRPLIVSHTKPDGDALGAMISLRALLRAGGMEATAMLFDELPTRYEWVRRYDSLPIFGQELSREAFGNFDGLIVVDTCSYSQLDPMADWIRTADVAKMAIDHHRTRDDLADWSLIDESAAATCLILYEWARAAGWPLTCETVDGLFTGIAMDTGWFSHSNTDARVFQAIADLVARGADSNSLYGLIFNRETPARVRLEAAALASLDLLAESRLALLTLRQDTFRRTGAKPSDTEDIVNEPLRIGSVCVSLLLVEQGDGVIRISLRSKSSDVRGGCGEGVDVSVVAQALGGGGHRNAAGAKVRGSLEGVRDLALQHLTALLLSFGAEQ